MGLHSGFTLPSGDKIITTDWTAVVFGVGWEDIGDPYQVTEYKKVGDLVFIRGLPTSGANNWADQAGIFNLPEGFRPVARVICPTEVEDKVYGRVDILAGGDVQYQHGGGGSGWVCLDGIVFSID